MTKRSAVNVVVEDDHQRMLVYRYLCECGVGGRQIRIERSPSGRGSAEKWVRQTFLKEVSVYRNRRARARTALIIVIDADNHTVQQRLKQLDGVLKDSGRQPIKTGQEQIARLIPKRNIETWILCLNGMATDERNDYKPTRHDWSALIPRAAHTLREWVRSKSKLPKRCVDSLQNGVLELKHLQF